MKSILVKFTLAVMVAGLVAACAGVPLTSPAHQTGDHIVQGGSLAGEGKIYFPLPFSDAQR
jgi:hypothetical protein